MGIVSLVPMLLAPWLAASPPSDGEPSIPAPAPFGSPLEQIDILNLPRLRPYRTYQASGHDRGGGFFDSGNFSGTDPDGSWVLLDAKGPGCLDRIWTTTKRPLPLDWTIEIDGALFLQADREALFPASSEAVPAHPEFVPPLAGRSTPLACTSYVPVPYQKSCRVLLRPRSALADVDWRTNSKGERIPHVYYQIGYRAFPDRTSLARATGAERAEALRRVAEVWSRFSCGDPRRAPHSAPEPPDGTASGDLTTGRAEAAISGSSELLRLDGPGMVTHLDLEIPGLTADDRSAVRMEIRIDGEESPSVDAPVDGYFAVGHSELPVYGLLAGGHLSRFYSSMPVPFRRELSVVVRNETGRSIETSWRCVHRRLPEVPADVAFLRAREYEFQDAPPGQELVLLDARGRGHLVGCAMIDVGDMEGDERISVDGGPVSEYHGTGTEDYMNFAWGLGHRASFPLHGLSASSTLRGRHANGYRFGLADVVPYTRSIRFTVEHGHANQDRGRYRGVVFWYEAR